MFKNIIQSINEPFYRNSISLIVNSIIGSLFSFIFWMIATRNISSANVGLAVSVISLASLIISLSRLGMDMGLMRYLPQEINKSSLFSTNVFITTSFSLIITFFVILTINYISPTLIFISKGLFLILFIGYIVGNSIYSSQSSSMIAIRRSDLMLLQNILFGVRIPLLLLITFLGIASIFLAFDISYIIILIIGYIILLKNKIKLNFNIDIQHVKNIFGFSIGNYTASFFSSASTTIVPLIILNKLGAENSAYFYIAYSIASIFFIISTSISLSVFVEGTHKVPIRATVIKSIKFIFIILLPLVLLIIILGYYILLLYSKEYSDMAYHLLVLLSISSFFTAIISIYTTIKNLQKDIVTLNLINFFTSALIITLSYMFISVFGLLGIGYSWILGNLIMFIIIILLVIFYDKWI